MGFDMNDTPEIEEVRLIRSILDGDQDAFCSLVLFYEYPLLNFLNAFLDDWDDARDIAQETFISVYYALPRWTPPQVNMRSDQGKGKDVATSHYSDVSDHPLAPWLYRIATNKALTFLKKQAKKTETQFFADRTILEALHACEAAFEDRYVVQEQLREALRQLSEEDALCIVFRFVLDDPYAVIAEKLHLSKEAVRKRVFRGLKVLSSVYKAMDGEEK